MLQKKTRGFQFLGRLFYSPSEIRTFLAFRISILLSGIGFIYTLVFVLIKNTSLALPGFFIGLSLAISAVLIHRKILGIGKFWIVVCTNLAVFHYTLVLGEKAGIYYFFFACSVLPFVLFSLRQKWPLIGGVGLSILGFLGSTAVEIPYYFPPQLLSQQAVQTLNILTGIMSFVIVCLAVGAYSLSAENVIARLERISETLQQNNQELSQKNIDLDNAYQELQTSLENLETSIRLQMSMKAQADFATLMRQVAHEVKNPMHMIRGNAEMMGYLKGEDINQVMRYSRTIMSAIDRTEKIVDAMMRYGHTSQGFYPSMLEVKGVLEAIATLAIGNCKQKYIELEIVCEESLTCFADETRVGQCLINLISNAVQYTPQKGKIRLSAEPGWYRPIYNLEELKKGTASTEAGNNLLEGVCISISDTGCGIEASRLPNIFIPDISSKTDRHNFGLGLAVVHNTIRDSRGAVTVESEVGKGTTFKLFLPAKEYQLTEKEWAMFVDPKVESFEIFELPEWMRPDR